MSQPPILDIHVHIYPTREEGKSKKEGYQVWEFGHKTGIHSSSYDGNTEDALAALNEANAYRGIVLNLFSAERVKNAVVAGWPDDLEASEKQRRWEEVKSYVGEQYKESNFWVCDVASRHETLVPFISVDPNALSIEDAQDHISELVENHGAKGIKLHPVAQKIFLDDPTVVALLRACVALELPILTHSGLDPDQEGYAEPKTLAKVLERVPEPRFIVAHLGGGAWEQTVEFAKSYPNVMFDCSEIIHWTGAPQAPSEQQLAQLILDVGFDRVMMGSDFPWYDVEHTCQRVMGLPLLAREQKEAILGANAMRFLKL